MFAISYVNQLALMKGTPVPTPVAATGFPVTNLYDGWPWRPFRFATAGANSVALDLSILSEDFDVIDGPLPPGAYWSKTNAAVCNFNNTDQYGGAGCMAVSGGLGDDYVALNFNWPAGSIFAWSLFLRMLTPNGTASATVQLIDLDSQKSVTSGLVPAWAEIGESFAISPGVLWTRSNNAIRVSSPTVVGASMARMQLRFYAPAAGLTALYDIMRCWPEPDFMAVLGSNLPPSSNDTDQTKTGGGIKLDLGVGIGAATPRFQLDVARPTSWALPILGSQTRRANGGNLAQLYCPRPPLVDPVALGMLWLGSYVTLPEGPEYPINVREMLPQERSGGGGFESQAVRRADLAPRRLELSVSAVSVEKVEEIFAALRHAHFGADRCLLIAPYKNVDTAFYGRVLGPDGIASVQASYNSVRASVVFEEEPFFRFTA